MKKIVHWFYCQILGYRNYYYNGERGFYTKKARTKEEKTIITKRLYRTFKKQKTFNKKILSSGKIIKDIKVSKIFPKS